MINPGARKVDPNIQNAYRRGNPLLSPTHFTSLGKEYRVKKAAGGWLPFLTTREYEKQYLKDYYIFLPGSGGHDYFYPARIYVANLRDPIFVNGSQDAEISYPTQDISPEVAELIYQSWKVEKLIYFKDRGADVVFDEDPRNPLKVNHMTFLLGQATDGTYHGRVYFTFAFMLNGQIYRIGSSLASWLAKELYVTKEKIDQAPDCSLRLEDESRGVLTSHRVNEMLWQKEPLLIGEAGVEITTGTLPQPIIDALRNRKGKIKIEFAFNYYPSKGQRFNHVRFQAGRSLADPNQEAYRLIFSYFTVSKTLSKLDPGQQISLAEDLGQEI